MFEVGDMVVCVDVSDLERNRARGRSVPELGGVYTVRHIGESTSPRVAGLALWLEEVRNNPNPHNRDGLEGNFLVWRFRKIRKPSIEIFREIVASVKGNRNVDA